MSCVVHYHMSTSVHKYPISDSQFICSLTAIMRKRHTSTELHDTVYPYYEEGATSWEEYSRRVHLVSSFLGLVTEEDKATLEQIQDEIVTRNRPSLLSEDS